MKYSFKGKYIIAEAETDIENVALLAIQRDIAKIVEEDSRNASNRPRHYKKHKKHLFIKQCWCGKGFKGDKGLHRHQTAMHKGQMLTHTMSGTRMAYEVVPTVPSNKIG